MTTRIPPESELLYRHQPERDVTLSLPDNLAEFAERHPMEARRAISVSETELRRRDLARLQDSAAARGVCASHADVDAVRQRFRRATAR